MLERCDNTAERTLIQIVPQYGPEPNGLADYASALANALKRHGITSVFVSATPRESRTAGRDELKTFAIPRRRTQSLAHTIQRAVAQTKAVAVLLHFSGYGYQKRGVPLWLLKGLRVWCKHNRCTPLITVFHELFATTSRPWQSSYWLSPIQALIARSLLRLSSDAIAPTSRYRDWLLNQNSSARVSCLPVFSNVGELSRERSDTDRAPAAVIFGLAGVEDRLFGPYRLQIERIISIMGIDKVIDIGPRLSSTPASLAGVPVIPKGALLPLEVSELLQHARFGFIAYPRDFLAKSGVFAAYAAHGVIPIVFSDKQGSFDGLEAGRHFLDGLQVYRAIDVHRLKSIQQEVRTWYAGHSLQVQARDLGRSISLYNCEKSEPRLS
jgi:hypothetical protein